MKASRPKEKTFILRHSSSFAEEAILCSEITLNGLKQQLGENHPSCLDCKLLLAERLLYSGSEIDKAMKLLEAPRSLGLSIRIPYIYKVFQ